MLKTNIVATPVLPTTAGVAVPTTGNTYVVGGNHTIDNSAYAAGTDANSLALKAYDKQLEAFKAAQQATYDAQAGSIANELAKSHQQYIGSRNDAYTNARLSAIGNNERLAAMGLAGNLYDYARSGTSETSRIAQDVALRKNISGLDQAQINAQNELQLALINAQKEADANYLQKAAEIEAAKIPYSTALAQAAAMRSSGGGGSSRSYTTSTSSKPKSNPTPKDPEPTPISTVAKQTVHNAIVSAASQYKNNAHLAARDAAAKAIANSNLSAADVEGAKRYAAEMISKIKR